MSSKGRGTVSELETSASGPDLILLFRGHGNDSLPGSSPLGRAVRLLLAAGCRVEVTCVPPATAFLCWGASGAGGSRGSRTGGGTQCVTGTTANPDPHSSVGLPGVAVCPFCSEDPEGFAGFTAGIRVHV